MSRWDFTALQRFLWTVSPQPVWGFLIFPEMSQHLINRQASTCRLQSAFWEPNPRVWSCRHVWTERGSNISAAPVLASSTRADLKRSGGISLTGCHVVTAAADRCALQWCDMYILVGGFTRAGGMFTVPALCQRRKLSGGNRSRSNICPLHK